MSKWILVISLGLCINIEIKGWNWGLIKRMRRQLSLTLLTLKKVSEGK